MLKFAVGSCVVAGVLIAQVLPANAQGGRRTAAESYAEIIDYGLIIEKAATEWAKELPWSEREAFIDFVADEVDTEMARFYAIGAMVDLFEAEELRALASFAATPAGRSALAKLPALGAIIDPIIQRQITDAAGEFEEQR